MHTCRHGVTGFCPCKEGSVGRAEDRAGDDEVMEKQASCQEKNLSPPSVLLAQMYYFFVSFVGQDKRRDEGEEQERSRRTD
jgi:hypothetical protein